MALAEMSTLLNTGKASSVFSGNVQRPGQILVKSRVDLQSNFVFRDLGLELRRGSKLGPVSVKVSAQKKRNRLKVSSTLEAIIFDCDGVILESEDLHRRAYNATFGHFSVRCPGSELLVEWKPEFYDGLQNKIGGGKPKMRWYFEEHGWPTYSVLPLPPQNADEREAMLDTFQEWKTQVFKDLIASGNVDARPGVLRLMDEAKQQGVQLAVCSAATKSSVVFSLENLLGKERFEGLDCFLAGDDVDKKKPDPSIYITAAERMGIDPRTCLVVEDSIIGLQAAIGANMSCIITYTDSTKSQTFPGAASVVPNLGSLTLDDLRKLMPIMAL